MKKFKEWFGGIMIEAQGKIALGIVMLVASGIGSGAVNTVSNSNYNPIHVSQQANSRIDSLESGFNARMDTIEKKQNSLDSNLKDFKQEFKEYVTKEEYEREKARIRDSIWREELKKLLRNK